jgi:hypothetical protein
MRREQVHAEIEKQIAERDRLFARLYRAAHESRGAPAWAVGGQRDRLEDDVRRLRQVIEPRRDPS